MNHAQEPEGIRCSRCGRELKEEDAIELRIRPITKTGQPHATRARPHGWLHKSCAAALLGGPEIVLSVLKEEASRPRRAITGTHRIVQTPPSEAGPGIDEPAETLSA